MHPPLRTSRSIGSIGEQHTTMPLGARTGLHRSRSVENVAMTLLHHVRPDETSPQDGVASELDTYSHEDSRPMRQLDPSVQVHVLYHARCSATRMRK